MNTLSDTPWLAWVLAAGAVATAILPQARALWAYLSSVLVSRSVLESDAAGLFMELAWTKLRPATLGVRYYSTDWTFIRPLRAWGSVPCQALGAGSTLIFLRGPWPILVIAKREGTPGEERRTVQVVYLRWSLNLERFLGEAAQARVERAAARTGRRHTIVKLYGSHGQRDEAGERKSPPIRGSGSSTPEASRFVYWKQEELGAPQPPSPFMHLSYPAEILGLVDEVKLWLEAKDWNEERGLPWRLGWMLYGEPGNGKTSLVRAVAQQFDLPIYVFDISTMSNQELADRFRFALGNGPCIILFEDFCRLFQMDAATQKWVLKAPCSMDALLNCICGVEGTDGAFIVFTANAVEKLEGALGVPLSPRSLTDFRSSRPQRVDRCIYLGPPTREARVQIASRVLADCQHLVARVVEEGKEESSVQFTDRCSSLARAHFWNHPRRPPKGRVRR